MRRHWKFSSAVALAVLLAAAIFWYHGVLQIATSAVSSPVLDELSLGNVAQAFASVGPVTPAASPRAAILPHHIVASTLLADLVEHLQSATPSTIVIIGPDHQNAGSTFATTTTSDWTSNGIRYHINQGFASRLDKSDDIALNDEVLQTEHSVLVPMAFLAHQFPNAKFVLLAVRGGFDQRRLHAIADQLNALLGPQDLVIASVDFSHYLPLVQADQEDEQSLSLLTAGDPDKLERIPADSPAALAITMRFAQLRGAPTLTILRHDNSAHILNDLASQSTTSYVTGVFSAQ